MSALGVAARSAVFCLALGLVPATAQDTTGENRTEGEAALEILSGDPVISRFSGFAAEGAIDIEGPVLQLIDISNPGKAPDGSVLTDAAAMSLAFAGDIGQVFGLAIDGKEPATIYATATAAFGLHIDTEGNWAEGQWGEGGPGAIYRLSPENGYVPELFATLKLDDRENTGAALGNIAFDASHDQLFVSDLESGMIYRVSRESGEVLGRFDHGVDGRSYFLDAELAEYAVLDVVPFDPESAAKLGACTGADGKKAPFAYTPSCWNVADFRRRVWGLGVRVDPETGESRLYYAVWGGAALGSDEWAEAGEDAKNSVWSIALTAEGDFDIQDIRREVVVPDFVPDLTGAETRRVDNPAISDIAFTTDGVMLLAERGSLPVAGVVPRFSTGKMGRVLRLVRSEGGVWAFDARYNIGNAERRDAPPYIRANASGGVAVGLGYNDEHYVDVKAPGAFVWATGDALCGPEGACFDNNTETVNGVQGMPIDSATEVLPEAALQAPKNGLSATPPDGVDTAYMVPITEGLGDAAITATSLGDIEIAMLIGAGDETAEQEATTPEMAPDPEIAEGDAGASVDLALRKSGPRVCEPGTPCAFALKIENNGPDAFSGSLSVYDEVSLGSAQLAEATGAGWQCSQNGSGTYCTHGAVELAPGAALDLGLTFRLPASVPTRSLLNCAEIGWLGRSYATRVRFVQQALAVRGYEPGAIDGLYGPQTAAAIETARKDFGLEVNGEIDTALIEALFGAGADEIGDENPLNDRSCTRVSIPGPVVSDHWVALSAFHRKFASARHDQVATALVSQHEPALSRFHLRYRSARHDGATTAPLPIHRPQISLFHQRYRSANHDAAFTRFVPLHTTALSVFHSTAASLLHDPATTRRISVHNPWLSRFHQRWRSARHDGRVTNLVPIHSRPLSNFHLRNRSARHDGTVTRITAVHGAAISSFHRSMRSGLHDQRLTRVAPSVHAARLSVLHRRIQSAQHDPWTTSVRSLHRPAVSEFHRRQRSSAHNPATTSAGVVHDRAISRLHLQVRSVMHDARTTTRRGDIHAAALSRFHARFKSSAHVTGRSTAATAEHASALSRFHRSMRSAVHNNRTTSVVPSHQRALSAFHLRNPSVQHQAATSSRDLRDPRVRPKRSEIERRQPKPGAVDDARKRQDQRERQQKADEARKQRLEAEKARREKQRQEQLLRQQQQRDLQQKQQQQERQQQRQKQLQEQQRKKQQQLEQQQRQQQREQQQQRQKQREQQLLRQQQQQQRQQQQKKQQELNQQRRQQEQQRQEQRQKRQQQQKQQEQRRQEQLLRQQRQQRQDQRQQANPAQQLQRFHNRAPSSMHDAATSRRK